MVSPAATEPTQFILSFGSKIILSSLSFGIGGKWKDAHRRVTDAQTKLNNSCRLSFALDENLISETIRGNWILLFGSYGPVTSNCFICSFDFINRFVVCAITITQCFCCCTRLFGCCRGFSLASLISTPASSFSSGGRPTPRILQNRAVVVVRNNLIESFWFLLLNWIGSGNFRPKIIVSWGSSLIASSKHFG